MSNLPEKIDNLEKVADLYLKSYKPAEIARATGLSPAQVKGYIQDYRQLVERKVADDPEFLDRLAENTLEALERMDNIVKEAWETYDTAKSGDMINQQINLLKVCGDLEDKRAKLLQLMGAKMDSGMMARMNKAEQVNTIVTRVIKEIAGECPKCRVEIMPRLAEAFDLMNRHDEAAEMRPVGDDVIDVESEEEWDDDQQEELLLDVFNPDL